MWIQVKKNTNRVFGHFCELKDGKAVYYNNIPKDGSCKTAMPSQYLDFAAFLVSKADVADHKFLIIENVCRNNCLAVDQLVTLLTHIEFEIEKLKIIRIAYPHVVDPENKKQLEKALRFEPSIHELNSFFKTAGDTKTNTNTLCTSAASQMAVENYAEKLRTYSNDAERFDVFKKGYASMCYTSAQVTLLLSKFIHDREKLDAARVLYYYCVDKENFMKTAEVFSYNETVSELQNFIDKQRN